MESHDAIGDDNLRAADAAMTRYATGDDQALRELYDRVAPALQRALSARLRGGPIRDEVVERVFAKLHHRGRWRPGAEVLPWALAIADRVIADRVPASELIGQGAGGGDVGGGGGGGLFDKLLRVFRVERSHPAREP